MTADCEWRDPHPDPDWERIREALIDLVVELGYQRVSEEALLERAGLDSAAFRRHFRNIDDCFRQILADNNDAFSRVVIEAYEAESEWRDALRAALYTAARVIAERPREFCFVMTPDASELARASRDAFLQRLVDLVDAGRFELDNPASVNRALAEGIFGSIVEYAMHVARTPETPPQVEQFIPEFMYLAVSAYLGNEAALEEFTKPAPDGVPQRAGA